MYDAKSIHSSIAIDDFFENLNSLFLRDGFSVFDDFGKISSITEFSDDTGVWLERYDLVEFDYILQVAEEPEYFHFIVEKSFMYLSFDILHVDQLESDCLALVK